MHNKPMGCAVLAAAILVGTTACGGSPATIQSDAAKESNSERVFQSYDAMPADQRMQELVEAARSEGQVVAYLRADVKAADIEEAFEAKYGIDLKLLNPGSATVVRQQIFEQAKASRLDADVIEAYPYELSLIYGESHITTRIPNFLKDAVSSPELASDYALETFQYPFLPAWNTNQIPTDQVPQTWKDFLEPVWRDRLVMVKNFEIWYFTLFDYLTSHGMRPSEFAELFRQIAKNVSTTESSNPASAFLASGQYLGGLNLSLTSLQKIGKGAPVGYEPGIQPVVLSPVGIGLFKHAAHPAAALLFSQWYVTEGQAIVEEEQFVEQSPSEGDLRNVEKVKPNVDELTVEHLQDWRIAYENLITGKEDVVPDYVLEG